MGQLAPLRRVTTSHVKRIALFKPRVGGKSYTVRGQGWYCLEEGEGIIWHDVCCYAGSGGIELWDGYIGPDGYPVLVHDIFKLAPAVLGVWHLNAGFQYGLLAHGVAEGDSANIGAHTLIWMKASDTEEHRTEMLGARETKKLTLKDVQHQQIVDRDCVLYQCQVTCAGLGPIRLSNGDGEELFSVPAGVVGSFTLSQVFCRKGLWCDVDSNVPVTLTLTWYSLAAKVEETQDGGRTDDHAVLDDKPTGPAAPAAAPAVPDGGGDAPKGEGRPSGRRKR